MRRGIVRKGRQVLVMEYVPGESLAEVVRPGALPVADACRAVRDAARGLAHALEKQLQHEFKSNPPATDGGSKA